MESLPSNIPSIREVHKAYHKDKELTEYIGKLMNHKVTNKTKSPKPFFRFLAHRIKYKINSEYREAFNRAAEGYINGRNPQVVQEESPLPSSSTSLVAEKSQSFEDNAVKAAKKAAKKAEKEAAKAQKEKEQKIEGKKKEIAEVEDEVSKQVKKESTLSQEIETQKEAIKAKNAKIILLKQNVSTFDKVVSSFPSEEILEKREQLVGELSNNGHLKRPEIVEKKGKKTHRTQHTAKWGDENDSVAEIPKLITDVIEVRNGINKGRKGYRKKLKEQKEALVKFQEFNQKLPIELQGKTTEEIRTAIQEAKNNLEAATSVLTSAETKLKTRETTLATTQSKLEEAKDKKIKLKSTLTALREELNELETPISTHTEVEEELPPLPEKMEVKELESNIKEEQVSEVPVETKIKKKHRKKPELTGSTGDVRAKSPETEEVKPLESVEPSTGPVQNEHTQKFLTLLRQNLGGMPKLAELVGDQLNRFYAFYGEDCCEGLEKGKNGDYTLKFAHPMQVFISDPFELLGIPKPGTPQASDKKEDKALLKIANQFLRNGIAVTLDKEIKFTLEENKFVLKSGCSVGIRVAIKTLSFPAKYSIELKGDNVSIEGGFGKLAKMETFNHEVIAKSLEQSNRIMEGVEILGKDAKPTDVLKANQSKRKRGGAEEVEEDDVE